MTLLSDKIRFAENQITLADGQRFAVKGHEWVRDQLWLPADGFKLWPRQGSRPCETCAALATTIVEHPDDNPTVKCKCGGLEAAPIIVTVLNLERQDGKTTGSMAYGLTALFVARNKRIGFLCASEDQAETLLRENYVQTIERNARLNALAVCKRLLIEVPQTHGVLEALSCSDRSVTGRTRTHLLIDEARDIPARVVAKLLPAVFAMHGFECPRGHVQFTISQLEGMKRQPTECPVCHERLGPWYARIVIATSSGVIADDPEKDWCSELVERLEREPHPNYHLFRSEVALNPKKSGTIVNAIGGVFGELESMSNYMAAEIGNQWTHKGDEPVDRKAIDKCTDKTLTNLSECGAECVAFLDTSLSVEKTSLVVLADDRQPDAQPWSRVFVAHLFWWELGGGRVIDENAVYDYLKKLMPMFSGLRTLGVDTTFSPWAKRLVKRVHDDKLPWDRKIEGWDNHQHQNRAGRADLLTLIAEQRIRLPDCEEMRAEFRGVKKAPKGSLDVWVDRNRKKKHADIIESLACCCYFRALEEMHGGRSDYAAWQARRKSKESRPQTATGQMLKAIDNLRIGGQSFGPNAY